MKKTDPEFSLRSEITANLDDILDAHRVLIRRARDRAKQMLFFFGLCRPTSDESFNAVIGDYRQFAIGKMSELTEEVTGFADLKKQMEHVLHELTHLLNPDQQVSLSEWLQQPEKFDAWCEQARKNIDEKGFNEKVNWRSMERSLIRVWHCRAELESWESVRGITSQLPAAVGEEANQTWRHLRRLVEAFIHFEGSTSPLHAVTFTRGKRPAWPWWIENYVNYPGATTLRQQVVHLRAMRPAWLWGLVQWFRNLPLWVTKHVALLLMLALGLFVLLQVEAVSSLIQNLRLRAALPFGLALLPLVLTDGLRLFLFRGKEAIPAWDLGGVLHRSFLARAPRRFFQRWPTTSTAPSADQPEASADEERREQSMPITRAPANVTRDMFKRMVRGRLYRLGYLLLWAVGVLLLRRLELVSPEYSIYLTVFLIVILLYSLALVGRMIDFWDYFESKAIRLHWLFYIAVGVFALLEGWGYPFFLIVFVFWALWFSLSYRRRRDRPLRGALAVTFWFLAPSVGLLWATSEQAVWRAPEIEQSWRSDIVWPFPGDGPVLVMAASGGGSRAALYTALTVEKLEAIQVSCKEKSEHCPLSDQLQAISSVSGGSLANAGYVARRFAAIERIPLEKSLRDWVSEDYIRPTLWGALHPFLSRGDSIERTWQDVGDLVRTCPPVDETHARTLAQSTSQGMKLGDICLSDLALAWKRSLQKDQDPNPPFPMPLFNTSTLDGHDLVITPLSKDSYTSSDFAEEARDPDQNRYQSQDEATWVFYRDGIYGLEDLLGEAFNPLLSTAVRASANFPFGFPLVQLETHRPLFLRPDWASRCQESDPRVCDRASVNLTDGGALSNSGMWSLFRLLLNKQTDLRSRGVLLILVDASKMDESADPEKAYRNLRGTIGDQAPIGQYLHRTMLDMLEAVYGDGIAITQIDLKPDQRVNIHTTWAFDPKTRKKLEGIFEERWGAKERCLIDKWNYLDARSGSSGDKKQSELTCELIDRARPPLD